MLVTLSGSNTDFGLSHPYRHDSSSDGQPIPHDQHPVHRDEVLHRTGDGPVAAALLGLVRDKAGQSRLRTACQNRKAFPKIITEAFKIFGCDHLILEQCQQIPVHI